MRRPESYPDSPESIETIETHFAWIFLSHRFVYKLKKPVRFAELELTTVSARRKNCELEIALNRRLAAETYIGVVPLGRRGSRLELECGDNPVDWLVKMYRLPAETTLERLLPEIETTDPRLRRLIETLGAFYQRSVRAPWSGGDYLRWLELKTRQSAEAPALARLAPECAGAVAEGQVAYVARNRTMLEGRVQGGRVCDAHGDLRPEHAFLTPRPQIIDCLEFSAELRQLDTAEEISFLALECLKQGRADVARTVRQLYREICSDDAPESLFEYYHSRRALVRAQLSAWHVDAETDPAVARHWLRQARWYMDEARSSIERAGC